MITEIIGYVGMVLLLWGYFVQKRCYLHLLLGIGCLVLVIYSILIKSMPFIGLNSVALIINIRQFLRYRKSDN